MVRRRCNCTARGCYDNPSVIVAGAGCQHPHSQLAAPISCFAARCSNLALHQCGRSVQTQRGLSARVLLTHTLSAQVTAAAVATVHNIRPLAASTRAFGYPHNQLGHPCGSLVVAAARNPVTVAVCSRSRERAEEAITQIRRSNGRAAVEFMECDLNSFESGAAHSV